MKSDLANKKLSSFFSTLTKTAAAQFKEIGGPEDVEQYAPMINSILSSPRYEGLKERVRGTGGVINFVAANEYAPFVELLVKWCFPPSSGDIYNMGIDTNLGESSQKEDYFVDAKSFLGGYGQVGGMQNHQQSNLNARIKLQNVLYGTPKVVTMKFIEEELGLSETQIDEMFPPIGEDPVSVVIKQLDAQRARVLNIKKEMEKAAREVRAYDSDTDSGRSSIDGKQKAQKKYRNFRNAYIDQHARYVQDCAKNLDQVNAMFNDLYDGVSREEDGFVHSGHSDKIKKEYIRLNKALSAWSDGRAGAEEITEDNVIARIMQFTEMIDRIPCVTEESLKIKENLKEFFAEKRGQDPNAPSPAHYFKQNAPRAHMLIKEFTDVISNLGQVLILKGVEDSPLCLAVPQGEAVSYKMRDQGIFSDFEEYALGRAEKSRSDWARKRGHTETNKKVVIVSRYPIEDLNANLTINLDDYNIDTHDAKVIVDTLLDFFSAKLKAILSGILKKGVNEQYPVHDDSVTNDRVVAMQEIPSRVERLISSTALDLAKADMAIAIEGIGYKSGINSVIASINAGKIDLADDNGQIYGRGLGLNPKKIKSTLVDEVNERIDSDTKGVEIRYPHVTEDQYIYKEAGKWGSKVGDMWANISYYKGLQNTNIRLEAENADLRARIASGNYGDKTKQQLEAEIQSNNNNIQKNLDIIKTQGPEEVPHFILLWGVPGTGKSVFAQALASSLECMIKSVTISEGNDMWLGNSEKNARKLINTILGSRKCVFVIDEIDRQIGGSTGSGQQTHDVDKKIMKMFLDAFDEDKSKMIENEVYVVMTTNNVDGVDKALVSRVQGNVFEVQPPDNAKDYAKFLRTFIDVAESKLPDKPWFVEPGQTPEQGWATTKAVIESIGVDQLAEELASKGTSFRLLDGIMSIAVASHKSYLNSVDSIKRGETRTLRGLPFTSENILLSAKKSRTNSEDPAKDELGIFDVAALRKQQFDKLMEGREFEQVETTDPLTGNVIIEYKVPQDVIETFEGLKGEGEEDFDLDVPQMVTERYIDPETGEERERVVSFEEMMGQGFTVEEPSATPTQQQTPQQPVEQTEVEDEDDDPTIASSTDYLYNYLKKEGMIGADGRLEAEKPKPRKTAQMVGNTQVSPELQAERNRVAQYKENNSVENLERRGVYYLGGNILVAPNVGMFK